MRDKERDTMSKIGFRNQIERRRTMAILKKIVLTTLMVLGVAEIGVGSAEARGGGSNFMNSPGYQRRLQESRGYVTNQSGSVVARPTVVAPQPFPADRRVRRRR